ncbi:MAG: hypothetical protein JXR37_04485 [Kiritimatiellae bacterium]|nr:hypothetical protein [Kiritimatiellia bacterium]
MRVRRYAQERDLTAHDAAYFELAERHGARLKTRDSHLLALASRYDWIS